MNQSARTTTSVNVYKHPHVEELEAISHKIHLLMGRIEHDPLLPLLKRRNPSITGVLERAAGRLEGTTELRSLDEVKMTVSGYEGVLRELERVRAILNDLGVRGSAKGA